MYSMVKEYMKTHNILVKYIYNGYGFPFGVVVGIGYNRVGWSMVNPSKDSRLMFLKPHQLPAIQMLQDKANKEGRTFDVFASKPYKMLVQSEGFVNVPTFNRAEGLLRAIEVAENGLLKVSVEPDGFGIYGKTPNNPTMINAILEMVERTTRVKRFQ